MDHGEVEQLGTPREIYERPATRFVAGFIGTSNVLEGPVQSVSDGVAVLTFGAGDRVLVRVPPTVTPGDKLEVSVRPEKIDLHRSGDPSQSGRSVLSGIVTEVVYHGTATNYTVTTAAGPDFVVFDQNASGAEDLVVRGDRVHLTWRPEHSYPIGA
jgi:spermidine/putrescine transport system ATP-binding protein